MAALQKALWRWRIRLVKLALPGAVLLLLAYTANQLLTGERGIVTWRLMQEQVQALQAKNDGLNADVARLTVAVARLKPDGNGRLDEDYVDEMIRRDLPMLKAHEDVILLGAEAGGDLAVRPTGGSVTIIAPRTEGAGE